MFTKESHPEERYPIYPAKVLTQKEIDALQSALPVPPVRKVVRQSEIDKALKKGATERESGRAKLEEDERLIKISMIPEVGPEINDAYINERLSRFKELIKQHPGLIGYVDRILESYTQPQDSQPYVLQLTKEDLKKAISGENA